MSGSFVTTMLGWGHALSAPGRIATQVFLIADAAALVAMLPFLRIWIGTSAERLRSLPQAAVLSITALAGFVVPLVVTIVHGLPQPSVHAEFSYLLAGDTFAHGRLSNPTPPSPEHFETMHELMRPSYASKYPPGEGIFLAVGELIFNEPIVGVFLAGALASFAVSWMLLAWFPCSLVLLGGVFTAFHPLLTKWDTGYWGGAIAFGGGALVLGSTARLLRPQPETQALALIAGSFILAVTRPFEGSVLIVSCFGVLAARWISEKSARPKLAVTLRTWLIAAVIGVGLQAAYNRSVTGQFSEMPYVEFQKQYDAIPIFGFLPYQGNKYYSSSVLEGFYKEWGKDQYDHWMRYYFVKMKDAPIVLLQQSAFCLLIVLSPFCLPAGFGPFLGILVLFILVIGGETWFQTQYIAPILPLLVALVVSGAQFVIRNLPQREFGWLAVTVALLTLMARGLLMGIPVPAWVVDKTAVTNFLQDQAGRHLVLVRYSVSHDPQNEWVYNSASLSEQRIVWARDLGREKNCDLLPAFPDRTVWILDADEQRPKPLRMATGPDCGQRASEPPR
jgi:hypothetical protein